MKRDSVLIFRNLFESLQGVPERAYKRIMNAILKYGMDHEEPEGLTGLEYSVFNMAKTQIDSNNKKYENGKLGAEYGKLGGRPKKDKPQENPTETPPKPQENPTETPKCKMINDKCKMINDNNLNNASMQVNKEETNKACACVKGYHFEDYSEVMDDCALEESVKPVMWEFIKHCQLNGKKVTNDKLSRICLDMDYQNLTAEEKIEALRNAIDGGYYDIKR